MMKTTLGIIFLIFATSPANADGRPCSSFSGKYKLCKWLSGGLDFDETQVEEISQTGCSKVSLRGPLAIDMVCDGTARVQSQVFYQCKIEGDEIKLTWRNNTNDDEHHGSYELTMVRMMVGSIFWRTVTLSDSTGYAVDEHAALLAPLGDKRACQK